MKLNDALNEENGIISKVIDGKEMKMKLPKKLKDLLKDNIINENKDVIQFSENKIKPMIVKEGLNENILCMESLVKLIDFDENTGINSIEYCGDIEIAELIHQVNEIIPILKDFVDNYENIEADQIIKELQCILNTANDYNDKLFDRIKSCISQNDEDKSVRYDVTYLNMKFDEMNDLFQKMKHLMKNNYMDNWFTVHFGIDAENLLENVEISEIIKCNSISGDPNYETFILGVKNAKDNKILNIDEALKENMINLEYQIYKYDPEMKDEMKWKTAIDEKYMIACEINKNMITPEYLKCLIESNVNQYINIDEIDIIGVVDTSNNKILEKDGAVESKLLDLNTCLYHDVSSNHLLPLKTAINHGYVLAKNKNIDCELYRVHIESVKFGKDQMKTSLKYCIEQNCIDQLNNVYKIEEMNLEIRIIDAIMMGIINIDKNIDDENKTSDSWMILQRKSEDPIIENLYDYSSNNEINVKILCATINSQCFNEFLVFDDVKESIAESIFLNHLELDPLICGVDEKKSIFYGFIKNEISLFNMKRLLKHLKDLFVGEVINNVDEHSKGKDIIEALENKDLLNDKNEMLVINENNFTIESVSKIDKNDYKNTYITKINPNKLLKKLNQLKYLENFGINTNEYLLSMDNENDSNKHFNSTIFESTMNEKLNLDLFEIFDNDKSEMCSIMESVERELIDVKTVEKFYDCIESLSFEELIKEEKFDIENNQFCENLSLEEAIENDLIIPELVYVNLESENKIINLNEMMECGMLNASENEINIENENKELITMKLNDALNEENGIISKAIDSKGMKMKLPKLLKDLLDENENINVDSDVIELSHCKISSILLREAMNKDLLNLDSTVKLIGRCSENLNNTILYYANPDFVKCMIGLNDLGTVLEDVQSKCIDSKNIDSDNIEMFFEEIISNLHNKTVLFNDIDERLLKGLIPNPTEAFKLKSKKTEIEEFLNEVLDLISNSKSMLVSNRDNTVADSLEDSINKSKLKLNSINRQIRKFVNHKSFDEIKEFSESKILEIIETLKSFQPDLSLSCESINKYSASLASIQETHNLSNKSKEIEQDLKSLKILYENINSELDIQLVYFENILSEFASMESFIQDFKFDFNELEIKLNEETKFIKISDDKMDSLLNELIKDKNELNEIEKSFESFDLSCNPDFKKMKLFISLTKDSEEFLKKIADLKAFIEIKENMIIQTRTRLFELFQSMNNFNEILDKTKQQASNIKSQNKTDKTLQEIIDVRKTFMLKLDEFERMKISCESFINNSLFQNKEKLIKIYNNTIEEEKDLYLKINEELVFQVESKISLLLIELGKLQSFVMDLPKNWDTTVADIENRITEIKSYLNNLQMMEVDLQEIDKVLSEDLSDHLEINFELLEKAIMNIQYCEKERLLTYTDLEKIYNIVSDNYLPTMITYENNKQLAENMIIETNQSLDEYIKDFDNHAVYAKDKEAPYVVDLVKDRKLNLQKLDNVLYEIEPLVEAVESYGFDLIEQVIELTSDYGSDCSFLQSIKNDIQEIRQKFHTLKNKMAGLDLKMVELLSPNLKSQISEKLANEYESWRSLNDVLIKLDPIQSLPEKLNKQLEEISLLYDQIKKKEIAFLSLKESINKMNSDNNNLNISEGDINETVEEIQIDYDTVQSNEIEDLNDRLKEIENLLESVYYKADYRMSILNELKDVINNYWPEMNEINSNIKQIKKNVMAIEAFPNNKDDKQYKAHETSINHSDSISILTEADNKSASSGELEDDDKFIEDFEMDTPLLNTFKPLETEIVNQDLVRQQYSNLKTLENDVKQCVEKLQKELAPKASEIIKIGGKSCELEINEFNDSLLEEIDITDDILEEKDILFNKALYFVGFLSDEIKKIFDWINSVENRLENIGSKTPDQKLIEIDLVELKSLNSEIFSNSQRLDKITSAITEILSYPYVPNKTLLEDIKLNIKDKYSELVKKIFEKHTELQKKYDDIGELDFALDDNIGILQEFENQIKNLTPQSCKGDPEYTYSCLKNLRLLSNAFNGLLIDFEDLNEKISAYGDLDNSENQRCRGTLSIFGKMKEISHLSDQIRLLVPEKDNMIQEILKNEKLLSKELHVHIDYLEKINNYLKLSPRLGFNQESVTQSNLIFTNYITDFNKQKLPIETSLRLALNHIESSPYDKCTFLSTAMKTLSHKFNRCQRLAEKRREKLKNYSMIVMDFDKDKQNLLRNILELETLSIKRMTPSKITITCAEQIKSIKLNIQNANRCFDIFESLSIRSFDIKCFGGRIDNSHLNLELREYGVKVAKIQKRLRERIRIFNQAYREDKLFSDSYASLNSWLDESYNMVESFKNEPTKVLDHLDKLKNLCKQLSAQYANFHCTIRYGSYLKDKCIADDPEKTILIEMLKTLRNKWNKIRNLINTEKTTINRKMIKTGNIYDAIKCLSYWINDSIAKFLPDLKLFGDIDTVEVLIDECLMTENEINNHKEDFENLKIRMLKEIQNYEENEIRTNIKNIEDQFSSFEIKIRQRSKFLQESLRLAEDFNTKLNDLDLWLRKAEKQLKIKSLPKFKNEADLIELIEKHEVFLKNQKEMKVTLTNFNNLGKTILGNCHPIAKNYISRIIFKIENRWNQINLRSEDRSKKLNESLGNLRGSTALIEELIYKVGEYLHKIQNENLMEIPNDVQLVNDHINKHLVFNNELTEIDNQIKNLIKEFKTQNPTLLQKTQVKRFRDRSEFIKNIWKSSRDSLSKSTDDLSSNNRLNFLNIQFNKLWKLSIERKVSLQNHLLELNEREQLKRFDFNKWKIDFLTFIKVKGLRLTDLFRRQPSRKTGYHTLDEFVNCLLKSGFPTNKYILQQVFSIFDKKNTNEISYQDFIDSMRPEKKSQIDKNINPNDKTAVIRIIFDIIEREVAECTCSIRYYVKKEGDNKYRFGQNGKMYMVRYLNAAVMVRIGGGWQTLTEFLKKNDPCRTTSSLDASKHRSFKSPSLTAPKTGKLERSLSATAGKRPSQQQKAESISSKIPSPSASRLSKK